MTENPYKIRLLKSETRDDNTHIQATHSETGVFPHRLLSYTHYVKQLASQLQNDVSDNSVSPACFLITLLMKS